MEVLSLFRPNYFLNCKTKQLSNFKKLKPPHTLGAMVTPQV